MFALSNPPNGKNFELRVRRHLLLLNNFSVGQPSSFCLQNLQTKEPLTKLFPADIRITNNTINKSINQVKFNINNATPTRRGIIETRTSGSMSFQVILPLINF